MKKSVLALAVLGTFAGVASAQSSVTMFGVVDLNVMTVDNDDRTYSMGTDGMSSSRLGFRGVEDLGGGLKASFWLEMGLAADTGGNAGIWGNSAAARTPTACSSTAVRPSACRTSGANCVWAATTPRPSGTGRCSIRSAPTVSVRR